MQDIRDMIEVEIEQERLYLQEIEKNLCNEHPGSMVCQCKNGEIKYYLQSYEKENMKKRQRLIGNENSREVIERKKEKFYRKMKKKLETNLFVLENMKEKISNYWPEDIYEELPFSYRSLEIMNDSKGLNKTDSKYNFHDDNAKYKFIDNPNITIDGTEVRSKGEVIIYNMLWLYGVKFKYERQLEFVDNCGFKGKLIPDFVIDMINGKDFFWAHLGKLEDVNYVNSFAKKVHNYHGNGIVIGENLILTSDRKGGTINSQIINEIIKTFILPYCKYRT